MVRIGSPAYFLAAVLAAPGGVLLLGLLAIAAVKPTYSEQLARCWYAACGLLLPWTGMRLLRRLGVLAVVSEAPLLSQPAAPTSGSLLQDLDPAPALRPVATPEARLAAAAHRHWLPEGPLFWSGLAALAGAAFMHLMRYDSFDFAVAMPLLRFLDRIWYATGVRFPSRGLYAFVFDHDRFLMWLLAAHGLGALASGLVLQSWRLSHDAGTSGKKG